MCACFPGCFQKEFNLSCAMMVVMLVVVMVVMVVVLLLLVVVVVVTDVLAQGAAHQRSHCRSVNKERVPLSF